MNINSQHSVENDVYKMIIVGVMFIICVVGMCLISKQYREKKIVALLKEKVESLILLSESPELIAEIEKYNKMNSDLDIDKIYKIDEQWINAGESSPFIQRLMANRVSRILNDFQKVLPSFKEIFITDRYGLNVGLTNKTSDYYQADEQWWKSIQKSKEYIIGGIEYDESAYAWAYPIYITVKRKDHQIIGIITAIYSVSSIEID